MYEGDLDQPLPAELRGHVDLLLANVPYVPTDEVALLPAEARLHEPRAALDGGADGLDVLRRVAAAAPAVAGARRPPAGGDQRPAGGAGGRHRRPRRAGRADGELGGAGGDRRGRHPAGAPRRLTAPADRAR